MDSEIAVKTLSQENRSPENVSGSAAITNLEGLAAGASPNSGAQKIEGIPTPLLLIDNIKGYSEKSEDLTNLNIKYLGEQNEDKPAKEENIAKFQKGLIDSLASNIKTWAENSETKDKPFNLQFSSAENLGSLSLEEYSVLYLQAVERAMQQNNLTAAQAKQINIYPNTEQDFIALSNAAPKESDIRATQQFISDICNRAFNIGEDREWLAQQLSQTKRIANISLQDWSKFSSSIESKATQDTSFNTFRNLVSQAINSALDQDTKLNFINSTARSFSFLENTTPETNKFLESENIKKALKDIAESHTNNAEIAGFLSNVQKTLDGEIIKAATAVQKEIDAAQMVNLDPAPEQNPPYNSQQNQILDAENTANAKDSATKKPTDKNGIDPEKVQAAKALSVGAVTIAGIATASVFFPPIAVLVVVGVALWYNNRKNNKETPEKEGAENSLLQDPDALFTAEQFANMKREEAKNKNTQPLAQDALLRGGLAEATTNAISGAHQEMTGDLTQATNLLENAKDTLRANSASLGASLNPNASLQNLGAITSTNIPAELMSAVPEGIIDDGLGGASSAKLDTAVTSNLTADSKQLAAVTPAAAATTTSSELPEASNRQKQTAVARLEAARNATDTKRVVASH